MNFQTIILKLQEFWAKQDCIMAQPYDIEKGAGTMNPSTFLRVLGPEPWRVAYVEPSRRPADGRYGDNQTAFSNTINIRPLLSLPLKTSRSFTCKVWLNSAFIRMNMIFVL